MNATAENFLSSPPDYPFRRGTAIRGGALVDKENLAQFIGKEEA